MRRNRLWPARCRPWNRRAGRRHPPAGLRVEPLEPRRLLAAVPVIAEFMADNDDTLIDGDGRSSDWIEVHNAGDAPVDLAGWHLTDDAADLTRWTFPSVQLDAGGFLVVFASGQAVQDYVDPAGNLHTNFQLDRNGEYLALVEPGGATVASQFAADGADYAEQFEDVSHGTGTEVTVTSLLAAGAAAQALVPVDGSLAAAWTLPGFVPDGNWAAGTTGVGFADVIADLGFWLKAEHISGLESGDPVDVWPDGSGRGHDAVQPEPVNRPIWIDDAVGGQAVVRFDGDDDVLSARSLSIGSETTVFFVAKNAQQTTDGSVHRGLLTADNNPYRIDGNGYGFGYQRGNASGFGVSMPEGVGGTTEQRVASSTPADDRFEIISYRKSAAQAELFRDAAPVAGGTQNDPVGGYHTGYNIGADPSFASREYLGDIAEILVFDRALDDEQHDAVLDYLAQQYGLDEQPEPPDEETGLVSYWSFDDATVTDLAGENDATSTVGAGFTTDVPAPGGTQSLDLTGTGNYVSLPATDFAITREYTVSAWVKPDSTAGGRFFSIRRDLTSTGGDRSGVNFGLTAGGRLYTGIITPPGAGNDDFNDISTTTLAAPAGLWTHVAATLEDDVVTMYVDGVPETAYSNSGTANAGQLKTTGLDVDFDDVNGSFTGLGADGRGGSLPGDLTSWFSGLIDEVAVWNEALTPTQIAKLADGTRSPPNANEMELVSYWNFDDGASVTDQVGPNDALSTVGATFSTDVPIGGGAGSLDLGIADNYVVLPADTYGIADAYSIAAWVKPAGTGGGRILSVKRDLTSGGGDRSGVAFGLAGGNQLYSGVITPPGAGGDDFNDISAVHLGAPAGQWSHIAVTFQDDRVTMYLNGNPERVYANGTGPTDGTLKTTGKDVDFDDANGSFSGIGVDGRGGNIPADLAGFFDGLVDELAVWNGPLHPTQVALLADGIHTPATLPDADALPPAAGLVSHWTFDAQTPADDVGANDAVGQTGIAFTPDVPAVGGSAALDLSGRTNFVTLPSVTYGIADEYTISAWIKPADTVGGRFFSIRRDLTAGGVDRAGVNFGLGGGNTLYTGLITPPGPANDDFNDITTTALTAPAGQWSHVAVTLKDGFVTMYLDGVAETVYSSTLGPDTGQLKTAGTNVDFHDRDGSFSGFGADGRGGNIPGDLSGYFSGLIDEVAVWNVAQDAENIALLADGTHTPATLPLPEPSEPAAADPGSTGPASTPRLSFAFRSTCPIRTSSIRWPFASNTTMVSSRI